MPKILVASWLTGDYYNDFFNIIGVFTCDNLLQDAKNQWWRENKKHLGSRDVNEFVFIYDVPLDEYSPDWTNQ